MTPQNFVHSSSNSPKVIEIISRTISDVVFELFGRSNSTFEVTVVGNLSNHIRDVLNNLKVNSQVLRISSRKFDCNLLYNRASIFFVRSLRTFTDFFASDCLSENHPLNQWARPKNFLFYIEEPHEDYELPSSHPNQYFGHFSHFSYFLQNFKYEIKLKTFEWWTQELCNQTQIMTLNTFNKTIQEWQNPLEINEKFQNFHNCTLSVVANMFALPIFEFFEHENMLHLFKGSVRFQRILRLVERNFWDAYGEQGNFSYLQFVNYTAHDFHPDISAAVHLAGTISFEGVHFGTFFHDGWLRVMIPVSESYTSYEKCLLPFDRATWTFLLLVFGVAFAMIFITNQMSQRVRDLVYGEGVNVPAYNILGTFFGIGQTKLPENNFARIILMSFIIFCLIFRTAYQGVFFEMFTTDMKKPPPRTFGDLRAGNYTLVLVQIHFDPFYEQNLRIAINEDEIPRLKSEEFYEVLSTFALLADPKSRNAILIDDKSFSVIEKAYANRAPQLLEQRATSIKFGITMPFNNYIFPLVTRTTDRLIESGIYLNFYKFIEDCSWRSPFELEEKLKVFSMKDLEFGFVIWLVSCVFAISSFMAELIYVHGKRKGKEMLQMIIGLYYFMKLLKGRLRRFYS